MLRTLNMLHHKHYSNDNNESNTFNDIVREGHLNDINVDNGKENKNGILAGNECHTYDTQKNTLSEQNGHNQLINDDINHNSYGEALNTTNSDRNDGNEDEMEVVVEEEIIEYDDNENTDSKENEREVDETFSNIPNDSVASLHNNNDEDIEIIVEEEVIVETEEEVEGETLSSEQSRDNLIDYTKSHDRERDEMPHQEEEINNFHEKKTGHGFVEIASCQGKRGRADSEYSNSIGDEVDPSSFYRSLANVNKVEHIYGEKDSKDNSLSSSIDDSLKRRKIDDGRQRSWSQSSNNENSNEVLDKNKSIEVKSTTISHDFKRNHNNQDQTIYAGNQINTNGYHHSQKDKFFEPNDQNGASNRIVEQGVQNNDATQILQDSSTPQIYLTSKSSSDGSSVLTISSESTSKAPRRARARKPKLDFGEPLKCSTPFNCSEIIKDFLFIGAGYDANGRCITNRANDLANVKAERFEWCKQKNICYALNMAASPLQHQLVGIEYPSPGIKVKGIEMNDVDEWLPEMTKMLDEGAAFIEEACLEHLNILSQQVVKSTRIKPPSIFVHCVAGVNRSPMVVVWWLAKYHNYNVNDAWDLVRKRRDNGVQWTNITLGGAIIGDREESQGKLEVKEDSQLPANQEAKDSPSYNWTELSPNEEKIIPVHPKLSWYKQALKIFNPTLESSQKPSGV